MPWDFSGLVGSRAIPPAQIFTDPEELCCLSIFTLNRAGCHIISGIQARSKPRMDALASGDEPDGVIDGLQGLFGLFVGSGSTSSQEAIEFGRV